MIIVFDLGNSDLSFACYQDKTLIAAFRTASDRRKSVDEYAYKIKELLSLKEINIKNIDGTILSSVVPSLTNVVKTAISRILPEPLLLESGVKTGLMLHCDNPVEVGSDIVAGCVGAINKYPVPCIIVDLGTATKIIAIDKNKAFIGCVIIPGVKTSTTTLVEIASQLPEVSLKAPSKVIGTNTSDCMNSGIINGNACLVEGMIKRFEKEMGSKTTHIITGGLGSTIARSLEIDHVLDKALIFDGLALIYYKNEGRNHE